MEHKLAIISVGVNCLEYSKKTFDSVKTKHPYQLIFINNGSNDGTSEWLESREDIIAYQNPIVSGLSGCWNMAILRGMEEGCDLFLVINNDIVLAPNAIDNMVRRFDKGDIIMATGVNDQSRTPEETLEFYKEYTDDEEFREHPDYSNFLISRDTIEKIGWFDENYFVAYFEDSDYHARIALSGEKAISTIGGTYWHYCSKTIKENPRLQEIIHDAFRHNRDFFVKKWGTSNVGDVPKMLEVYWKHPFTPTRMVIGIAMPVVDKNRADNGFQSICQH